MNLFDIARKHFRPKIKNNNGKSVTERTKHLKKEPIIGITNKRTGRLLGESATVEVFNFLKGRIALARNKVELKIARKEFKRLFPSRADEV